MPEGIKYLHWVHHHFTTNWEALMKPPVLIFVALVAFVSYYFGSTHETERVGVKDERISFLSDQVNAYKDRLQGATPDQAAKQISDLRSLVSEQEKRLNRILNSRELTEKQSQEISKICGLYKGTIYDLAYSGGDVEAWTFLNKLEAVLDAAAWKEVQWTGNTMMSSRPNKPNVGTSLARGIIVLYYKANKDKLNPAAAVLVDALRNAGVDAQIDAEEWNHDLGKGGSDLSFDFIHIVVGSRF